MNRENLIKHIQKRYRTKPEYLWKNFPQYAAFHHADNQKWFALLMAVSGDKLGLTEVATVDIVNLKAHPAVIGSLRKIPGVYPAYHMNKEH